MQLGVHLALVGNIQPVGFLQRALLVRVHVDMALNTFLALIGPGIARHPLPLALRAFVLTEAALPALVRRLTFSLGTSLGTVLNIVPLLEA